jgi:nucleoside permease NupC
LIAIISFVGFINAVLQWFGSLVGADYLTFEFVLGKIFVPISWLMGVENDVSVKTDKAGNTEQGQCWLTNEYLFFLFFIGHWYYEKKFRYKNNLF